MMVRKMMLGVLVVLMTASCAAPQPAQPRPSPTVAAALPTATRARAARPTATPTAQATATATVPPTVAPSATATTAPTATPSPSPTVVSVSVVAQLPAPKSGVPSGVLLALNPHKYPTPTLLTPDNNATYHVSQPVVHIAWSATPTDLMKFGQTPGCVSDATNFRRAFESYQLIIHSLDGSRPDQVQWTDLGTEFDLNLTTVPRGRYSWSVNVVTLCESYEVGLRNDTRPTSDPHTSDPAYHKGTLQTTYVGAASPTSETRVINWIP
jgi:hypothetical protein